MKSELYTSKEIKNMKNINRGKTMTLQAGLSIVIFFGSVSFITHQHGQNEIKHPTFSKEKDTQFLVKAAQINLEEIQLGQLAQQKSVMMDVKELGQMMEKDHRQSLSDLTALAKKKSIAIPTTPTRNAQEAYKKLVNKTEAAFDKDYCNMMVSGHKDAIAMFEKESKESDDAEIKQFVTETLPHLRMHLEHAISCQKKCEKM
jgi:putative membrane protein